MNEKRPGIQHHFPFFAVVDFCCLKEKLGIHQIFSLFILAKDETRACKPFVARNVFYFVLF